MSSRTMKRYPFGIVYRELADEIRVLAIAGTKRRPGYWRGRRERPSSVARSSHRTEGFSVSVSLRFGVASSLPPR